MLPRELFGVGVRILAVWFWTQAVYWGFWGIVKALGTGLGNPKISEREDAAEMVLYMLLGVALMKGARALIWLGYGDAPKPSHEAHNGGGSSNQDVTA